MEKINKVLYVAYNDLSLPNGPGVNEYEFLNALALRFGPKLTALLIEPINQIKLHDRSNYQFLPRASLPAPFNHLFNQFSIFWSVFSVLRHSSVDLVIFRITFMPWFLFILHKLFRFKYVIKTAGLGAENLKSIGGWRKFVASVLGVLDRFFTRYALNNAVAVDACTSQLVMGIMRKYDVPAHKIIKVENATNTDKFRPQLAVDARCQIGLANFSKLVGYVGGSPSLRGAKELILVLPELLEVYPGLGVLIVGYDRGLADLEKNVIEAGLDKHIIFTGSVPYSEVPKYISSLDVGVAFDDWEKLKITGNSNQKIRQYISSGKPVVASPGGNEFLENNGLGNLVDHTNNSAVAENLLYWLNLSEVEVKKHSHLAREYAENHLSVDGALERRLVFWNKNLECL